MNTPLTKRKLDLENESEKKKVRIITTTSLEVETIEKEDEIEEEEEGDSIIDINKMTPKQLMKVLEKPRIHAEKAKLRGKKKKTRILNSAKTILSDLILDIEVDDTTSIIDYLNTLVTTISLEATDLEKVVVRKYETKRGYNLMEQISAGKVALSTRT